MTVVTLGTEDRIMSIWRREVNKAMPDAKIEVVKEQPKDIGALFEILAGLNDDVLYTLPVHVVHDANFTSLLGERDFIGFKPKGSTSMSINFFAATNNGLKKILDVSHNRFQVDPAIRCGCKHLQPCLECTR